MIIIWTTPDYEKARKGEKQAAAPETKTLVKNGLSGKMEIGRRTIQLKAYNGKFICAESNHSIIADKEKASTWETFILVDFGGNSCALIAHDNTFLSAELQSKAEITASRNDVKSWENFTLVELGSNMIALKAFNGKYLSVDSASSLLSAVGESPGEREKFELIIK
jgi:hypothetical protein